MHLSIHPPISPCPSIHPSTPHSSLPASTHPSAQLSIHPRGPSLFPTSPPFSLGGLPTTRAAGFSCFQPLCLGKWETKDRGPVAGALGQLPAHHSAKGPLCAQERLSLTLQGLGRCLPGARQGLNLSLDCAAGGPRPAW